MLKIKNESSQNNNVLVVLYLLLDLDPYNDWRSGKVPEQFKKSNIKLMLSGKLFDMRNQLQLFCSFVVNLSVCSRRSAVLWTASHWRTLRLEAVALSAAKFQRKARASTQCTKPATWQSQVSSKSQKCNTMNTYEFPAGVCLDYPSRLALYWFPTSSYYQLNGPRPRIGKNGLIIALFTCNKITNHSEAPSQYLRRIALNSANTHERLTSAVKVTV